MATEALDYLLHYQIAQGKGIPYFVVASQEEPHWVKRVGEMWICKAPY